MYIIYLFTLTQKSKCANTHVRLKLAESTDFSRTGQLFDVYGSVPTLPWQMMLGGKKDLACCILTPDPFILNIDKLLLECSGSTLYHFSN